MCAPGQHRGWGGEYDLGLGIQAGEVNLPLVSMEAGEVSVAYGSMEAGEVRVAYGSMEAEEVSQP